MTNSDSVRILVNGLLTRERKTELGQFMTPAAIADFMAGFFDDGAAACDLLDAGAGVGSLSIAAVQRLNNVRSIDAWEIDPLMRAHLAATLAATGVEHRIHADDFISSGVPLAALGGKRYSHAILNPPYRKLGSDSIHRLMLRKVGIETVNLYSAFVSLAIMLMQKGGQIVAIIPRSFCNGPYYRPFRHLILKTCSLERVHVFDARDKAFRDDEVLQENVIVKLVKSKEQGDVLISSSRDERLTDYHQQLFPFVNIVEPNDRECFFRIPTQQIPPRGAVPRFRCSLSDLGVEVSTGPAVDFRLKAYWLDELIPGSVPFLYPHHFAGGFLQYPKRHKKPNALKFAPEVRRWLLPNHCYVLVKRFTSKEERRRVVAYVYDPAKIPGGQVAFENHWNVFHTGRRGLDDRLARGLAALLNSTAFDNSFRLFSGHTQVNATDLRNMKYPSAAFLYRLGERSDSGMSQTEIDELLEWTHEHEPETRADSPDPR